MMDERRLIDALAAGLPRPRHQLNGLHESDAELVRLPGTDVTLAITTDAIVEEIDHGLYRDPYLAGWMCVTACLSDLAAVGASPVGLVLSEVLPGDLTEDGRMRLQAGIAEAVRAHGTGVLGGDTSISDRLHLTATGLGIAPARPLTRTGVSAGDRLYVSGALGVGAAYAAATLLLETAASFRPVARLEAATTLVGFASACIDTSDGLFTALDELMRMNGLGVRLDPPMDRLLHARAARVARRLGVPPWTMLAGPHGEFELVFTIPATRHKAFVARALASGWSPIPLGRMTCGHGLEAFVGGMRRRFDTGRIRNLFNAVGGDPQRYLHALTAS